MRAGAVLHTEINLAKVAIDFAGPPCTGCASANVTRILLKSIQES